MASTAVEQLRAERRLRRETDAIFPSGNTPQNSWSRTGLATEGGEVQRRINEMSVVERGVSDASLLGQGLLAAPAHFATQSPIKTVKDIGGAVWDTGKNLLGVTGILGSRQAAESRQNYVAHPLFFALDVGILFSAGAGSVFKTAVNSTIKSSTKAAVSTAVKSGVKESIVLEAMEASRSILNPARLVRGKTKPQRGLAREVEKSIRTGDVRGYTEQIVTRLLQKGVDPEKALTIAKAAASDMAQTITKNIGRMKTLDAVTHPVGASFRGVGAGFSALKKSSAVTTMFGKASESAVGKYFSQGVLESNKKTAVTYEKWLSDVVDARGMENTIDNRSRVLREIKEMPEFSGLDEKAFFDDMTNYIKADAAQTKLGFGDDYVLVKNIPIHTAESMVETIRQNIKEISGELLAKKGKIDPVQKTVQNFDRLSELMTDTFGQVWKKYEPIFRKSYGVKGNIAAVEKSIMGLTERKPTVNIRKPSPIQAAALKEIEDSAYQLGYAPAKDVVVRVTHGLEEKATQVVKKADDITWEGIEDTRNVIGRLLDDWGFSIKGVIEGAQEFAFARNFGGHLAGEFRQKFGNVIRISKPVTREIDGKTIASSTKVSIPVERLYDWLREHRVEIQKHRLGGLVGEFRGVRIASVFDIKVKDLTGFGFKQDVAEAIVNASKKSLREVPINVVGIGEKFVNLLRASAPGYDTFLRGAMYMRYQSPLAIMFQAQQHVETGIMAAMMTKDARFIPGVAGTARLASKVVSFGERMTSGRVLNVLNRTKNYLKKIEQIPSLEALQDARDVLLTPVRRGLDDSVNSGEFIRMLQTNKVGKVTGEMETKASILTSARDGAFWLNVWKGGATTRAAQIGDGIAQKFGMTLSEAVERLSDGTFKNPRLVREMQDVVQQALHYRPGFQTSPLVKTLNIAFFPFRFQAKSVEVMGKWVGSLEPMSRLVVLNNVTHFANWAASDEGSEWLKKDEGMAYLLYRALAYTTAWEQISVSVDSISRGQLFGGNTGLIGGVPLGFVANFLEAAGVIPADPETINRATGRPFTTKSVPRDFWSDVTALTALEEFFFMMVPGLPLYTVSGGLVKGISYRSELKDFFEQIWGIPFGDPREGRRDVRFGDAPHSPF